MGHKSDWLVTSLPTLAHGGVTAQIAGRTDKAWAVTHANLARLMREAVGGKLTLLKVSRELKLANLAVHKPWG